MSPPITRSPPVAPAPSKPPTAGEVLVQTLYSGISHGTEMNVYRGVAPQWNRIYDRELRLLRPATDEEHARPARGDWTFAELELEPLLTTYVPFAEAARGYEVIDHHSEQVIQVVLQY